MKHVRIYEEFTTKNIQVGDYVLIDKLPYIGSSYYSDSTINTFKEYFNNNIGIVVDVDEKNDNIKIKFYNPPYIVKLNFFFGSKDNTILYKPQNVKYVGKTPEEIKIKMESEKYNI